MTDAELRGKLLKHFYDLRDKNGGWVPVTEIIVAPHLVTREAIANACQHLADAGLVRWELFTPVLNQYALGKAKITGSGIDVAIGSRTSTLDIRFPEAESLAAPITAAAQPPIAAPAPMRVTVKSANGLEFDIALSFAGEDRSHAEKLATLLKSRGVRVFYDEFFQASLWGKNLYQHLQEIYKEKARYCIVFVSEAYVRKSWTKHELEQAQARSFVEDREYILPVRLDDTVLPGVNITIGYIDLRQTSIERIAHLVIEKLGIEITSDTETIDEADQLNWKGELVPYNGHMVAKFWPKRIEEAQHRQVYVVSKPYERIRYGDERRMWDSKSKVKLPPVCHDCGVLKGQLHVPSCDMEECPACGDQRLSCGCKSVSMTRDQLEAWREEE